MKSVSPAKHDPAKAGLAAQRNRLVKVFCRALVARPVTAAIDEVQRFGRIGQRNDQWMIPPQAFVIDVHSLLALAGRLDHGAVGLQHCFVKERLGLLSPDLQTRLVERFLQGVNVMRGKPTTEVAGGGRVGPLPF